MNDLRIKVRVYVEAMRAYRDREGLTLAKAALRAGCADLTWGGLETLRLSPLRPLAQGDAEDLEALLASDELTNALPWRKPALAIAKLLGQHPSKIWTFGVLSVKTRVVERAVCATEVRALLSDGDAYAARLMLPSGEDAARQAELRRDMLVALATLPKRLADVLRMRFVDGLDLEECGARLFLTRERIRQMEAKALRLLRDPANAAGKRLLVHASEGQPAGSWMRLEWHAKPVCDVCGASDKRRVRDVGGLNECDVCSAARSRRAEEVAATERRHADDERRARRDAARLRCET